MSNGTTVSVIIPVLHEAHIIEQSIQGVRRSFSVSDSYEIIVVDGDSQAHTLAAITDAGVVKIKSVKGRALQMNCGAAAAKGEVLLFLHADTRLPTNALSLIKQTIGNAKHSAGGFKLKFDSPHRLLAFIALTANFRVFCTRIPYGDQAIFITRSLFDAMGGYADIPLMEDVELMHRVKKYGVAVRVVNAYVVTSARRWLTHGIVRTTLRNHLIRLLYGLGVSPARLARLYTVN